MKNRACIFLGPAELAGLVREYPDKLWNSDCIALTPDVYEFSKTNTSMQCVIYPEWVQSIRTFSTEDYQNIKRKLISLESESSSMRGHTFLEDEINVDWNHQSNYSLAFSLIAARNFANQAYLHLMKYLEVEIFSLSHAGEFYFDSCIQPTALCHELKLLGITVDLVLLDERAKAFTYQPHLYESMPNLFSENFVSNWKAHQQSVLIATAAIYSKDDQQKLALVLNNAYAEAHRHVYPLPLWQVINASDQFADRCTISQALEQLSLEAREKCINYSVWLTSHTERFLLDVFGDFTLSSNPLFRAQINRLHKRHLFQTLTYLGWRIAFDIQKTQMLALTNQDSSINGPLASAAQSHGIQVIVFPHGHIINWRTPCDCIVASEWWQPKQPRTLWGKQNQCLYFDTPIHSLVEKTRANQTTQWMILYNGVQENIVNSVAWPFMQQVVNLVVHKATVAGAQLVHRLKPGDQTPVRTFCELLGLDNIKVSQTLSLPLSKLLINTDLVVSVDEPSSALWEALSMGCAVILITDRILTAESIIDDEILQPLDLEKFKSLISSFVKNPTIFEDYRKVQQEKYLNLRTSRTVI
jgi:hypothetical protein